MVYTHPLPTWQPTPHHSFLPLIIARLPLKTVTTTQYHEAFKDYMWSLTAMAMAHQL